MTAVEFQHEISIDASVNATWRVIEQIEDWPAFVPTISSVVPLDDGPLEVGSRARLRQPGLPPAVWVITRLVPPTVLEWRTRLPGLSMTASHELEPAGNGCVQRLGIVLEGPGARAASRLAGRLVDKALAAENTGFKQRVET